MQAWQNFLSTQEKELGKETIDKWLRTLKVVHFDSANLYLEAQDSFQLSWFEEHMRSHVKTQLVNNNHRPIKVHITLSEAKAAASKDTRKGKNRFLSSTPLELRPDQIDVHATLANFVPGKANEVLFRFFTELCYKKIDIETNLNKDSELENPRIWNTPSKLGQVNPIYIHGRTGTGKTHLLMALTQKLKENGLNALYVRTETFTEHVVSAIRSSEMQTFRKSYRTADVLLVDDIHILSRRAATQEEFFHTFNALHTSGRQIIISSQCPPPLLEEIEPRLVSRFEWGISFQLEKLDSHELEEVLGRRAEDLKFPLKKEIVNFLVETFPSNPNSLHRALDALILHTHLEKKHGNEKLDIETAERYLKSLIESEKQNALTTGKIISTVASFYEINSSDILGKSHKQECALPRQVAMHLCRKLLRLPFMKIGQLFSRDHSTVMTSIKQIQAKSEAQDLELNLALHEIKRRLEQD